MKIVKWKPIKNTERTAHKRVQEWFLMSELGDNILIAEAKNPLHGGDLRWILKSQIIEIKEEQK